MAQSGSAQQRFFCTPSSVHRDWKQNQSTISTAPVSLSKEVEGLMFCHGLQRSYTASNIVRTAGNQLDIERNNALTFGMKGKQLLQAACLCCINCRQFLLEHMGQNTLHLSSSRSSGSKHKVLSTGLHIPHCYRNFQ
jgi:hypothetical protein